ncbi:MAG: CPBP family glutamic-type intramembrane protease [Bacilli bacterium]|jgi:hypothetical protein
MDHKNTKREYRKCPHCGHIHDYALSVCPKCGNLSEGELVTTRFPNVIELAIVKQIMMFLIGWGGLTLVSFLLSHIFLFYANNTFDDPLLVSAFLKSDQISIMHNLITYLTLFVGLLGLLWKDIIKILHSFKSLRALISGLSYGALLIVAVIAYNLVIAATGYKISDNQNESSIVAMMTSYPLMSFIAFVLLGPIVEEITYRLGLFSLIHRLNRPLAYIVTMLVFGVIHMSFNGETIINELINLPSYIIAGTILTYTYEKEGFAASTYAHILNNLVSFLLTVIRF